MIGVFLFAYFGFAGVASPMTSVPAFVSDTVVSISCKVPIGGDFEANAKKLQRDDTFFSDNVDELFIQIGTSDDLKKAPRSTEIRLVDEKNILSSTSLIGADFLTNASNGLKVSFASKAADDPNKSMVLFVDEYPSSASKTDSKSVIFGYLIFGYPGLNGIDQTKSKVGDCTAYFTSRDIADKHFSDMQNKYRTKP